MKFNILEKIKSLISKGENMNEAVKVVMKEVSEQKKIEHLEGTLGDLKKAIKEWSFELKSEKLFWRSSRSNVAKGVISEDVFRTKMLDFYNDIKYRGLIIKHRPIRFYYIAYGLMKGRTIEQIENKSRKTLGKYEIDCIISIAKDFGGNIESERLVRKIN